MTVRELALLVKRAREEQQKYFRKDRSTAQLERSKQAERELDEAVERVLDAQAKLFGDD